MSDVKLCPHDSLSGGIDSGVWRCDECDAVGRQCIACRSVTFVGEPHSCEPKRGVTDPEVAEFLEQERQIDELGRRMGWRD